jgi:2-methylcitrate dehydratase
MGKIKAFGHESLKETEARMTVFLKNGGSYDHQVIAPKGDPRVPMTFDEIVEKFKDLSRKRLSKDRIDRIIHQVKHLEDLKDTSTLLKLCCAKKND